MWRFFLVPAILLIMTSLYTEALIAKPIVIAHRGASGYLPEHTLESATLAYALGADYIEQDLVLSKDLKLIVLHDIHLETVTNVAVVFPNRAREDGRFYALDFTLAELKSLRVHERTDSDQNQVFSHRYQGQGDFKLATLDEHIELVRNLNRQFDKDVGIYPEIKSPAWHREQGHDISKITVSLLEKYGLNTAHAKVFMQCFDFSESQRLRNELNLKTPLIQLIADNSWNESATDYDFLQTPEGLVEIAKIANGIGPWIPQIIDLKTGKPSDLLKNAHDAGLQVHPYTFRTEELAGKDAETVLKLLFDVIGIDGLFTDFTDIVVRYINAQSE